MDSPSNQPQRMCCRSARFPVEQAAQRKTLFLAVKTNRELQTERLQCRTAEVGERREADRVKQTGLVQRSRPQPFWWTKSSIVRLWLED